MDHLAQKILEGATPSLDEVVDQWSETFPLLQRLEETPQDAQWHAEGDVFVHTGMVLDEVYERLPDVDLSPLRRLILILGAIFHDIAKPLTTRRRHIDGVERIIAPRHAERGASVLAIPILELGLPPETARQVLALVAYHHEPKHLVIKESSDARYRRLARLADIELLYHLEQADMRGRRCTDRQEQIDFIEFFGLVAKDHGLFGPQTSAKELYRPWWEHICQELCDFDDRTRQFVFARALEEAEAEEIYAPEEAVAKSYSYRDDFPELVVLCGPSGSGKSRYAREVFGEYELVSMDEIRQELTGNLSDQSQNGQVRSLAKERLKEHLRRGDRVVWDATNLRRDFRRLPLSLGRDYGAFTRLIVFHMPRAELIRRNRERPHPVPDSVLESQLDSLQWPALDEAHQVVFEEG